MSAIKRSESPGKSNSSSSGHKIKHETTGGEAPAPIATAEATSKLVFGLNARANKVKHDEYAEQRLKASPAITAAPRTRATSSSATRAETSNQEVKLNGTSQSRASYNSQNDKRAKPSTIRAPKYGSVHKPQDLRIVSGRNSMAEGIKNADGSSTLREASTNGNKQQVREVGALAKSDAGQNQAVAGSERAAVASKQGARARSNSPERNKNSGCASGPAKQMARRKSAEKEEDQKVAPDIGGRQETKGEVEENKSREDNQQVITKARTQFNILPPPQLAMATTGRGSVVSYAKSRIYDKPSKPILSNPPLVLHSSLPSSLVFAVGEIPQAIMSGRKPPKQVNVSKARKEWEGGEPFAKCRSRKRLAAAQRNKNKLLIHESWSMTSVVATQQLQLQQALAASSAAHRTNVHQSDPAVKVLQRGSVLERVQQFERAPSSSSFLSSSISSSASASDQSQLDSASDDDDYEAVLTIDHANLSEPRPLSPSASKQAAYRQRVSSIQQQQLSSQVASKEQQRALARSVTSSLADAQRSGAHCPAQRRLSLRRRSSIAKPSSSSLVPRFYHPQGTKPNTYEIELEKRNIVACFDKFPDRKAQLVGPNSKRHFHAIALSCGFSEYYKIPLLLYVKHLIETRPELLDEANLMAAAGQSVARRRSSLAPLNPNNVPTSGASNGTGGQPKQRNQLTRSSSQQLRHAPSNGISIGSAEQQASGKQASSASSDLRLKKSASIDSSDRQQENGSKSVQYVSCEQFLACWKFLIDRAYDAAAKFTHLLTLGQRDYLLPDDFVPLVQSLIDDHPGLKFLRAAPDFHMRYIQTVIARIYYCVNRSWTGKIKLQELRKSNLLAVVQVLAQEEDINQVTDYFSYEHFYVIYCKFWNLDQDHDLLISKEDLARHNDASISSRIIERIFSGIVSKQIAMSGKMSYSDFVWFLIAEEDKKHPRSVEYWFRLMDLDGDGYISMYELEYFYYEQMKRLELMNIEALPFLDTACQILDLVNPKEKNKISLADLKRTKMSTIFFDTFINLEKYLEHESREFVSARDFVQDGVVISDWDRYASEEYENMVTEESSV